MLLPRIISILLTTAVLPSLLKTKTPALHVKFLMWLMLLWLLFIQLDLSWCNTVKVNVFGMKMYTSSWPITALLVRNAELWLATRCTFSRRNHTVRNLTVPASSNILSHRIMLTHDSIEILTILLKNLLTTAWAFFKSLCRFIGKKWYSRA